MSDPRPPDEDELVSRVLDDDATAEERVRVASDPRLQARVREFERVRALLADVAPVPAATQDSAITAALASSTPATETQDHAPADELHRRRTRRGRRVATGVAVAAALLIGLPLLAIALTGRGTEQKAASSAGGELAARAPSETTAPFFSSADASPVYAGDLGSLATVAELQVAVADVLAPAPVANQDNAATSQLALPPSTALESSVARTNSAGEDPAQSCISYLGAADPAMGSVTLTATATWRDSPALVVVYRATTDTIVVVNDDCMVLARIPG